MAVASNIAIAWPFSVGSIPSGWSRETALDSRYILGAATGADTDLTTDRGFATHGHASSPHTPTQNAHTHTFTNPGADANNTIISGTAGGSASDATHGHAGASSASTTASNNSVAITVDTASNDLSFVDVIWIKSDGTPSALPTNCLAFFASDSLPSGWSRVNGDRYLRGATSGGDGGATGGSNTHVHTSPPHTHTQSAHSHAAATSSASDTSAFGKGSGSDVPSSAAHTHQVSLNGATATNQSVTTTIDAANHEPPFKKLNVVQPSAPSLPTDIICLWLGTNAAIPSGWLRFTSMDGKWLKGAAANGESNVVTGGSSQHNHTASSCQPIQNAHTHSAAGDASVGSTTAAPGVANTFAAHPHSHTTWDVSSDVATNNAVGVTIDSNSVDSALPKHRTVIYVQFSGTTPTPSRVMTVYDTGLFETGMNQENVGPKLTPEQEWAIWHGDIRHYPGLLPLGPPR